MNEWLAYLDGLTGRCGTLARALWVVATDLGIDRPAQSGPTDEGGFIFVWDDGASHFELEAMADDSVEWFYSDRATGRYDGGTLLEAAA